MPEAAASFQTYDDPSGFSIASNTGETQEQIAEMLKTTPEQPETPPEGPDDKGGTPEPTELKQTPEKPLGKPRDDPKARMLQATQDAAKAKRERDEIQRRYEAQQAELEKLRKPAEAPKAPEPPKKAEGRPKLEDFDGDDALADHAEAVARWVAKQDKESAQKEAEAKGFEEFKQKRVQSFAGRMTNHLKKDPEFWSRIDQSVVGLRPLSILEPGEPRGPLNFIAEHFLVSEQAPALIEYFSGNPEELQRFGQIRSEAHFWLELGKIEKGLAAVTTAPAPLPQTSKAAPPARPVTGGPTTRSNAPSEEDSDEEFSRKRLAQELAKRGRR